MTKCAPGRASAVVSGENFRGKSEKKKKKAIVGVSYKVNQRKETNNRYG